VLPTFVIGLREGVEASLIVGIVAAFLRQRGARREMRWVWAGVALAIALCTGVAIVLEIVNENLPQREQERLETVIALVAVAMVTSMIVWMTRHARGLRGELEEAAGSALAEGSAWALVVMAFLAVLREGLETAVFLLSTFQASTNRTAAASGALLGILLAVAIGWGIYRGGVRIDLGRFFTVTGLVLVLVAAGLVAFAAHTAHEAGWLNVAQDQFLDLSGLIKPGSVPSALFTGVLGIQPKPTVAEAIGWFAYFVPVATFVVVSSRRKKPQPRKAPAMATG
jgi:high-affinity iron transporter